MKILVGNLDFGVTEESVRSAFELYGPVEYVSFLGDTSATSVGYGFALVEMKYSQQAHRAIAALNGARLGVQSRGPLFLVPVRSESHRRLPSPDFSSRVLPSHPAARRRQTISSVKTMK